MTYIDPINYINGYLALKSIYNLTISIILNPKFLRNTAAARYSYK